MGDQYLATRRELTLRLFKCERCGARGDVAFGAVGISGLHREGLLNDTAILDAGAEAEVELRHDAERVLALVRCPTCGRRRSGAVLWACVRVAAWCAVGLGLAAGLAAPIWLLVSPFALVFGAIELLRVRRANRAVFHKLAPGTSPDGPLPVARALAVAPPPIVPLASPAPPPVEPRNPDAAPSVLVDRSLPPSDRE